MLSKPMKLSNAENYSTEALLAAVASNRFSHSDMEQLTRNSINSFWGYSNSSLAV